MKLRRRRLWFVMLVGLVLAGGVWMWWASSHAIWCKDTDRIKIGMTQQEVHLAMGRPPDWTRPADPDATPIEYWNAIDGTIAAVYDGSGVFHRESFYDGIFTCQWQRFTKKLGF